LTKHQTRQQAQFTGIKDFSMIVLITGASSGFGEEMARKFVREGHQVIAAARRLERLLLCTQSWATIIAGYDGCDAKVFDTAGWQICLRTGRKSMC
jgi:NADP-dependent 3-hydroxy acid dehydrogenase YdfG